MGEHTNLILIIDEAVGLSDYLKQEQKQWMIRFLCGIGKISPSVEFLETIHTSSLVGNSSQDLTGADAPATQEEETHIPIALADCTSLDEASAFVEQASIQQLSPEASCLSSAAKRLEVYPLPTAIALYKSLTLDEQREFCFATGLGMPQATLIGI